MVMEHTNLLNLGYLGFLTLVAVMVLAVVVAEMMMIRRNVQHV